MKTISPYCGAGGIDEGLKQVGIITTIAIDHWKDACETFKLNHPDTEVICGKVADYIESLPKADIVVGGAPCPEFSNANVERTFDLCEVNNFWKVVEKCQPGIYLMENVPDLQKKFHNRESYLINSADYGVPQKRKRRFWTNLSLPDPTHAKFAQHTIEGKTIPKWISVGEALNIKIIDDGIHKIYPASYLKRNKILAEKHHPNVLNQPAHTIATRDRVSGREFITDGIVCRKHTNTELAILQGFPIYYKWFGGKDSVHRQIGNAVPPPVIKAFFDRGNLQ